MDTEADIIDYENIDITDVKHVYRAPFIHRRTSLFVTIDAQIQLIDIEKFMEMGMNVARLTTTHSTKTDKVKLINKFDQAATFLAHKYGLQEWPFTKCVELKSSAIQTGLLAEEVHQVLIAEGTEVILTNEISEFDKCNEERIFVDNPYLTSDVQIGMELNISHDEIILKCTEKYENSVKCTVTKSGYLQNMAYLGMRGAVQTRPYISNQDLHLSFALEYDVEMIIISYPRNIATISKIKEYFGSKIKRPLIVAGISTQEGLSNIDDFVRETDGILLSREYLAYEMEPALYNRMVHIQSLIAGKCRQAGKPFYISGDVLQETLMTGDVCTRDLSDVTNAILEGASGFILSEAPDINYVCDAIKMMNELCAAVEPLCMNKTDFWQLVSQIKMPVNAAEAGAISCAAVAIQTNARLIIVPTVTGRTAYLLNWLQPNCIIIGVSTKIRTIRILKAFRSVIPLLYQAAPRRKWYTTVQDRIKFALQYAVGRHWIEYGNQYITLEKGDEDSPYCDTVRVWNVTTAAKEKVKCHQSYDDFDVNSYDTKKKTKTKTDKKKIVELKKNEEELQDEQENAKENAKESSEHSVIDEKIKTKSKEMKPDQKDNDKEFDKEEVKE